VFFELLNDSRNPFDNEHYVLFNIALGGNLGGNIPSDFVREVMEIDYIRIYK
jgi:beta-glucanase (GH16 family)